MLQANACNGKLFCEVTTIQTFTFSTTLKIQSCSICRELSSEISLGLSPQPAYQTFYINHNMCFVLGVAEFQKPHCLAGA